MAILYVGIDLAKNVFALHGVDEHGKAVLVRPSVPRARLHQLVAALLRRMEPGARPIRVRSNERCTMEG